MSTYTYRDQLSIDTPEQVVLHFPIAGLGSRMLAHLADACLQGFAYLILVLIIGLSLPSDIGTKLNQLSNRQGEWLVAAVLFLNFLYFWGYYTLFEAFWNGETPGKRWNRIRVIKDTGRKITFFESMTRNFLRMIDMLPTAYAAGIVTILASKQNKRLGDLLAGTIVVRQEKSAGTTGTWSTRSITAAPELPAPSATETNYGIEFDPSAISRLSTEDLVMIESFFARIPDLDMPTIDRIANQMLASLCRKMQIAVPVSPGNRRCLDAIAYALRDVAIYRNRSSS